MTSLAINDPHPGLASLTCPTTTLVPGNSTTCTATYNVTDQDLRNDVIQNTATAVGIDPQGSTIVSAPSSATVTALLPPKHLKGRQKICFTCDKIKFVNILTWQAPTEGETPVAYQVFRDGQQTPLKMIPADHRRHFKFCDPVRKIGKATTYFIVSIDQNGNASPPARVTALAL